MRKLIVSVVLSVLGCGSNVADIPASCNATQPCQQTMIKFCECCPEADTAGVGLECSNGDDLCAGARIIEARISLGQCKAIAGMGCTELRSQGFCQ